MKDKRILHTAFAAALLLALLAGLALAQEPAGTPLGTAFTYQGQLKQSDQPYTGTCDIKFGLFDVSTSGTAIATLTKTNIAMEEGFFTVSLDYGSGKFPGDKRWLEMAVRCPSGSGSYTTLAPRQELTAAPYALHAANADLLDGSHASSFAGVSHDHWGETWYGSGTALTLDGGAIGIAARGTSIGLYGMSEEGDGTGVLGLVTAGSGTAYGVKGQSHSPSGSGVYGEAKATSGLSRGVEGVSDSDAGTGVVGRANSAGGYTNGVWGESASTNGKGVAGVATAGSGTTYGVYGKSNSTSGRGVFGEALATGGSTYGVLGKSASSQGYGVYGFTTATSGSNVGTYGQSDSTSGYGVQGFCSAPTGGTYGVHGTSISTSGTGVYGQSTAGTGATFGVHGQSDSSEGCGVFGEATSDAGTTVGVLGKANTGVSWGTVGWNDWNGAGIGAWSHIGDLIQAYGGDFPGGTLRFKVDQAGNVYADGTYNTFAQAAPDGSTHVTLYGLSSTEVWVEELGSGALVDGLSEVAIDPAYARIASLDATYNVYLTAACQEPALLFVSMKAVDHFVVQGVGLDGRPSSCGFDYRLAAKRLGYQDLRLEVVEIPAPAPAQGEGEP